MTGISSVAVWGSLGASVVLGGFMGLQAVMDPPRRARFALFSAVWWLLAILDFLQPRLGGSNYEMLRVAWCGAYAGSLLWLFAWPLRWALAAALGLPAAGALSWVSGHPEMATTVTFVLGFGILAAAHARLYRQRQGYASSVLAAYSAALAVMCGTYTLAARASQAVDARIIGLGYAHYALVCVASVLLGWVHLPRELRGRSAVRVRRRHAALHFAAVLAGEVAVQLGLLTFFDWPPVAYLAGTLFQLAATLLLYFHHSHNLVIHTDNVTGLLEERTAKLRAAQAELAGQNLLQARKLEEQARELQAKAEVIDRQRRLELAAQTAGEAAHDIQNLIAPILTHVSELQQGIQGGGAQGTLERVRAQVEQLLDLNGQMLALSRRGRLDRHPVRLGELLEDLRGRFPGQPLRVACRDEAWVLGSWSQLSRALSNLVTNAFEAEPRRQEEVRVRCGLAEIRQTRRCHLGFLPPGRYAAVEVEDAGPGIPADILERIFEPFFSSKKGGRSGSGLGLSIVTAVMEDHRGVLDLRTGPEGSCFTLYLPAVAAPGGGVDEKALCGNETVMVIDDDSAVLRQYGRMLEEAGYSVITAPGGPEALRRLQEQQADLLLLDLKMPRMTGLETFFGALHLRPGVRAVIHSSYVSGEEARRLGELGAAAILQKPASRLEVLKTVRQVLDERLSRRN